MNLPPSPLPRTTRSYFSGCDMFPPAELCPGCNNFDLDQELWPEELGNNEEHRGRTRVAEETRCHLSVGPYVFGPRQILGDLDHVGDCHTSLLQHADDVFPGQLGLACDVLRKIAARGKAGRAGRQQPSQVGPNFDGVAIAADLAGDANVMNCVIHCSYSFNRKPKLKVSRNRWAAFSWCNPCARSGKLGCRGLYRGTA